jgi:uncharacterized protein (TIGR02646 family)
MKYIIKSAPQELDEWKNNWQLTKDDLISNPLLNEQKKEIWEKFSGEIKNTVKKALVEEQGFICCYCQQQIELDSNTIIEHFIARNTDPTQMFEYKNIFACCDGGDEQREKQKEENILKAKRTPQHCDRKKGDSTILINPLDDNCESYFDYSFNPDSLEVSITGVSEKGVDTVNKLNLDIPELRSLRGQAVAGFIFDENGDYISHEDAMILASQIKNRKQNNHFEPFCVVLEYVLKNL